MITGLIFIGEALIILMLMVMVAFLWWKVQDQAKIIADVLDIHTAALRRHESELAAKEYPKYFGASHDLPMDCGTPEESLVAITHAVFNGLEAGVPLANPETAPFFVGEGDK